MSLADRLKGLRLQRALSQTELSRLSGVSRQMIWRIENGERSLSGVEVLKRLARALGVSLDELAEMDANGGE